MAYFRCIDTSGGGGTITAYWIGSQTEYEAVSPKLSTTEYLVIVPEGRVYRIYHGSTLIYPTAAEVAGWDFYIKDVDFYGSASGYVQFVNMTAVNFVRPWRMDIKATATQAITENIFVGSTSTGSSGYAAFELFLYSNQWRIYTKNPTLSGDRNLGDLNGLDVTIISQNDKLSFYTRSGETLTLVKEFAYTPTTGAANVYWQLGRFGSTYADDVHIDYFGFKFLDNNVNE